MQNLIDLIDESLFAPIAEDERYVGSVFRSIRQMAPKHKGARYEAIVEHLCASQGMSVESPKSSDHDRIINGVKTEIKGSCLNKGKDVFSFLQIRPDQDYEQLLFLCCHPSETYMLTMSKALVSQYCEDGTFKKQHGGNSATSRTFMYYGNEKNLEALGAKYIDLR